MTLNANRFNGNDWNYKQHDWKDNTDDKRQKNAEEIFRVVTGSLKQEDDIFILQEFPYMYDDKQKKWFFEFKEFSTCSNENYEFKSWYFDKNDKDFCVLGRKNGKISITIAVIKKNSKWRLRALADHPKNIYGKVDYSNRYIELINDDAQIKLTGVHAQDAYSLRQWLAQKSRGEFIPDVIAGDFNAGNYIKDDRDAGFELNRQNYIMLTEGFVDTCSGMYTTNYNPPTEIDHILIKNLQKFNGKIKEARVDYDIKHSDHYPLFVEIDI